MSVRDRLALAAAVAVGLAAASLLPVFDGLGWLLRVLGAVVAVSGAASLVRRTGAPRALEPLGGLLGLAAYVGLVFAGSTLSYVVVPGAETLPLLGDQIGQGLLDVEELAPPVPTNPGLVLLAVLGVGGIAIAVDALAVTLRRPAVAGLPLLLLFAVPAAVLPGGLGWWPFALGAAGWMALLLADSRDTVSRWGTPLRAAGRGPVTNDPSTGRFGRRIGAAALGVAIVVPAFIPLDGRVLGSGGGEGLGGGSRTTTTYNPILELGGQLQQPEPHRQLISYRTNDPRPDYLRLTTLDLFDEDAGWSSSQLSADLQDDAVQDGIPEPRDASFVDTQEVTTTIAVGRIKAPWLPTPFPPSRIAVDGPWLWDEEAETVFSTRTSLLEVDEPYTVESARIAPTAGLLRGASTAPKEIADVYAVRPALTDYSQALLDRTVAGAETDYDKVAAIQELFTDASNGFVYDDDADVPGFNQEDALERFLRGKRGFCEQYSSAMAALVRALGIPARVAVGFTQGTRLLDGTYRVTTSDAHAWPEVWFSGAGWVRFEPTPRSTSITTPDYSIPPVEAPLPDGADPSAVPAPTATSAAGPTDPGAIDRGDDLTAVGDDAGSSGPSDRQLAGLAALAALTALLAAPSLLTLLRRRRRAASPGPLSAWAQVRDDAVDVGHVWRPADSPRAAAAHLGAARSLGPIAAASLERLAVATERARYAPPDRAGDADDLLEDVVRVRAGLQEGVSPRQRWLARLAPPSTLRWASAGLGGWTADLLDRFDGALSAVGERVRHPGRLRRRSA